MSKRQILAILGVWVIIFLFLGFPIGWDRWIAVVTGVLIIMAAYKRVSRPHVSPDSSFVQNDVHETDDIPKTPEAN
jgi:hypothetical protein